MKTREDILFDVKWPYYVIQIFVFGLCMASMGTYQFYYVDMYIDEAGLLLLPHLVICLSCAALFHMFLLPRYYLWAFSNIENARWLQDEMTFPLPFYPKRKWYYNLIPYYGKYEARIAEITIQLSDNSNLQSMDLTAYEDTEPISTHKIWYYTVLYFLGVSVIIATIVLITIFAHQKIISTLLNLAIVFLLLAIGLVKSYKAPKQLIISPNEIQIGPIIYPWGAVNTIHYYEANFDQEILQIITKQNDVINVPVNHYGIKGKHLYGYALYYFRQHLQSYTS